MPWLAFDNMLLHIEHLRDMSTDIREILSRENLFSEVDILTRVGTHAATGQTQAGLTNK